ARFLSFARKPLAAVTLSDLQAWTASLGQGRLRPATQNRALTAVKSLLSFAHQTGYLPVNVGVALKLRPNRDALAQRILPEAGVALLIEAAAIGRDRVLLKLLYASGVRVSELCGLKWADAVPRQQGGQITVFGKGGKTRTVLLKQALWDQLFSLKGAQADGPIFASRRGGGPLDPSQVRRIVYAAAEKAGFDSKVSPHWLRHSHASHALDHSPHPLSPGHARPRLRLHHRPLSS